MYFSLFPRTRSMIKAATLAAIGVATDVPVLKPLSPAVRHDSTLQLRREDSVGDPLAVGFFLYLLPSPSMAWIQITRSCDAGHVMSSFPSALEAAANIITGRAPLVASSIAARTVPISLGKPKDMEIISTSQV